MRYPLIFAFTTLASTALQAQIIPEKQVPVTIQQALKKLHPTVQHLEWERARPYYEATFTLAGNHRAIKFDTKGNVAETEVGVPITGLPTSISTYMKGHYPKVKFRPLKP